MIQCGLRWGAKVVLVVIAAALLGPTIILAQGQGTIEGQVANGTADGDDIGAGLEIILRVTQNGVDVGSQSAETDAEGHFQFSDLETGSDFEYWPTVNYKGVTYSVAEGIQLSETAAASTTLAVFETTEDDAAVVLDAVHLIIQSFGEVLRVSEIHIFGNTGDRAYVGVPDGEVQAKTVSITLPDAAVGVALQEDSAAQRIVEVDGGLADTEPLLPGAETSTVFFSYHLMVTGDRVPLVRQFPYAVTNISVLVSHPGLVLESKQLEDRGTQTFQEQQYQFLVTEELTPDDVLEMMLLPTGEGMAMPSTSGGTEAMEQQAVAAPAGGSQGLLRWLGFGLVALAVLGAMGYGLGTGRTAAVVAPGQRNRTLESAPARRLIRDLADLDSAYEAGEIDDVSYEQRRAETLDHLRSM